MDAACDCLSAAYIGTTDIDSFCSLLHNKNKSYMMLVRMRSLGTGC
jgi:hypothetical protein